MSISPNGPQWKRVVVKLSGEALRRTTRRTGWMRTPSSASARIWSRPPIWGWKSRSWSAAAIFFGGSRGRTRASSGPAPISGMLATVMNALAIEYAIEKLGRPPARFRRWPCRAVPILFAADGAASSRQGPDRDAGGGHRQPVLHHRHRRGLARGGASCDAIMKATQVDGTDTADPKKDPAATRYEADP